MDNKIETVRIGNKAGVPSVPNVLAEVKSYEDLRETCEKAGIGHDLVLQSAFGDSGHTTFFIKSEADFRRHEHEIVGEGEIKIMKRIDCRGSAIEACATKEGTIVGPLMTELVGFKDLTPYRGGWCGNEILSTAFPPKVRQKARELTFKFGEQLRKEGYRGYFELDFLIDKKTGDIWLGELNPRITGCSSMTNHAAFAHADAPLFLFHLLEFSKKKFNLDTTELNNRWANPDMIDSWSQMVIKHTADSVDICTEAPETGIYKMLEDGRVVFDRFDYHRRAVESENEAFFLRILQPGDYRYEGADIGILVTRGRSMTKSFQLNERAKKWIHGIKQSVSGTPLAGCECGACVCGTCIQDHVAPCSGAPSKKMRPAPSGPGCLHEYWPDYQRWWLREGAKARPTYARVPPRDDHPHARDRAALRRVVRACGGRRSGGTFPQFLLPAALSVGMLPGDLARRGTGAGAQLRLQLHRLRQPDPADRLAGPGRHGHVGRRFGGWSTASTMRALPCR